MMDTKDQLVDEYLQALRHELRDVPKSRADEVVAEVRAHIAESRSEASTEAEVRNVLDLLGDPADIAAEARERFPERSRSRRSLYITVAAVLVVVAVLGAFLLLRPKGPFDYQGAVLFAGTTQAQCADLAGFGSVTVTAASAGKDMGHGRATFEWTAGGCWLAWSFPLDRAESYLLTFNSGPGDLAAQLGPTFSATQLKAAGYKMTYQLAEFPNGFST